MDVVALLARGLCLMAAGKRLAPRVNWYGGLHKDNLSLY